MQIIPHITDEIKRCVQILSAESNYDFVITEIGGTVGDIESLPYIEAVRQMKWECPEETLVVHLTLIPYLAAAGELKTKPTQHSVKQLLEFGVQPDILVCRTEHELTDAVRTKVARFCNVAPSAVIQSIDAETIYDVPLLLMDERLDQVVLKNWDGHRRSGAGPSDLEEIPHAIQAPKIFRENWLGRQIRGAERQLQIHRGSAHSCGCPPRGRCASGLDSQRIHCIQQRSRKVGRPRWNHRCSWLWLEGR